MKGRTPKDPAQRQRRNRASTADVLDPTPTKRKAPPLPTTYAPEHKNARGRMVRSWHAATLAWWRVIWRSPMASRWLEADIEGLYVIAMLRDQFFRQPTATTASEIRQQETRFGLDVLARRRLDWRLLPPPTDDEKPKPPERAQPTAPGAPEVDPRFALRAQK